jgi:hypothetical protein
MQGQVGQISYLASHSGIFNHLNTSAKPPGPHEIKADVGGARNGGMNPTTVTQNRLKPVEEASDYAL